MTARKRKRRQPPAERPPAKAHRPLALTPLEEKQRADCCVNAALILQHAHESADALLKAYDLARQKRGRVGGMTTDEEQDLLRAMLVMAAAGLDAMTKQIVRDALPLVLERDKRALNTFEKFLARKLDAASSDSDGLAGSKFLARVLSRPVPQLQIIEEYIGHLTESSLQSTDALFQVAAALGLSPQENGIEPDILRPIFHTRNAIIHELDINLDAPRRNRNVRRQQSMIRDTNRLIAVGQKILSSVDATARELGTQ